MPNSAKCKEINGVFVQNVQKKMDILVDKSESVCYNYSTSAERSFFVAHFSVEGDKILGILSILLSGGVSEWLREIELELHWRAANASRETTTL